MGDENAWREARRAAAALTDSFDSSGVDVVILDGQFWHREERAPFQDNLKWSGEPFFVTLEISYDEALQRVQGDATRGISSDPDFLKRAHVDFKAIFEPLKSTDLTLDSPNSPTTFRSDPSRGDEPGIWIAPRKAQIILSDPLQVEDLSEGIMRG